MIHSKAYLPKQYFEPIIFQYLDFYEVRMFREAHVSSPKMCLFSGTSILSFSKSGTGTGEQWEE